MAVREDRAGAGGGPQLLDQRVEAGAHVGGLLAVFRAVAPHGPAGHRFPDLGRGEPLVVAVVELQQLCARLSPPVHPRQLAGLDRPSQRAHEHAVEIPPRQAVAQALGLAAPRLSEWNLRAAGVLEGAAPLGLAVASQHHLVALHSRQSRPSWRRAAGIHCTPVAVAAGTQLVYAFAEGSRDMRDLLGGKGANVAEMTRILGPERVPAGFTITTEACVAYMEADRTEPDGLNDQVDEALGRLEEMAGKRLGDPEDPLLVSVRSGARESMPGMLDTVLNLGLNDQAVEGLARSTGNERFAWDSYRRFVQMFGNVCRDVPGEKLEDAIKERKRAAGVTLDTELSVSDLRGLVDDFKALYRDRTGEEFPQDPRNQLAQSIRAVFDSWLGERAVEYRRINRIPDDWGTAVNVQQMVFGNKGERSCSGVAFSRDEITGAPEPSGDFLVNAQGEDVVSGVRTPLDLSEMAQLMPDEHAELLEILRKLEAHYGDMQDTEFTVEEGRLYMLQTRNAKRPAQAAVRFAVDAEGEGMLDRGQALATIDAASLEALLHKTFERGAEFDVLARGVGASPGAAKGEIVFSAPDAVAAAGEGRDVVLVRPFTEADDVAGFHAARGILTSAGGKASHAGLVARGMGRPCVSALRSSTSTSCPRAQGRRPGSRRGRPDRHRRHHRDRDAG